MKKKDKKNNKSSLGEDDCKILVSPNEPLINYRGIKFSTRTDIIIYKNQSFVNDNLKWINTQAFKLYYDKKYFIQCLYIKNSNAINKREVLIYSQNFTSNFASILPFLIDLSNYLRINIITYQYNNKEKESMNYLDINLVYNYLNKLEYVRSIILLGLSVGNKINMNIVLSKANLYPKTKLKAMILISPTWVYNLASLKNLKNSTSIKNENEKFFKNINLYNIPVFIIHGKKDSTVKYFLSMSFMQQIKKKLEWYPKNGTHINIINDHRTKLLMKMKQFLLDNDLLKKVENDPYLLAKIKLNDLTDNDLTFEERDTAFFNNTEMSFVNNKQMKKKDEEYYGYYNKTDIMGKKKNASNNNEDNDDNGIYTISQPKIKNENDMTINQTFQDVSINDVTLSNQTFKNNDTLNPGNNGLDVTLHGNNENDITINENTIDYGNDTFNKMDVSFLPGDIVPSFATKAINNTAPKKEEDDVSFM